MKIANINNIMRSSGLTIGILVAVLTALSSTSGDECSLTPVSGSKVWQTERSCMCCQESGEREASVTLICPKARIGEPRVRKVLILILY
ncbi:Bursicon, partial [Armadillidium nasatum]